MHLCLYFFKYNNVGKVMKPSQMPFIKTNRRKKNGNLSHLSLEKYEIRTLYLVYRIEQWIEGQEVIPTFIIIEILLINFVSTINFYYQPVAVNTVIITSFCLSPNAFPTFFSSFISFQCQDFSRCRPSTTSCLFFSFK